ncbi:efflux RND transporter periplasmic adaptor subunit [Massilia sp. RP-1-19]|uniref:Efflux RND transporter periplasmic adaptor subunit n=1 Tax=Massilia polaris TaxID=2728846 RepID=A0A848HKP4_9BURK|nr:efflux RND transporter periplasmic adaptor subunit [Massilia polaris]NML59823.1 efflux RND transporter periplasmic adaptor subunit [Massilia polaris]
MKNKIVIGVLVAAVAVGGAGYGLYALGKKQGMAARSGTAAPAAAQAERAVDPASGRKVLHWHDPMVPGQKFDKPGKSPFMDMQLVPVYAAESADEGGVSISPRVQQNLGIRTAEVTRGSLSRAIEAVGSIAYNERDVALVQARSNGYVERLFVRAPLDPVKKGQPLAELYMPDWVAAQEEFLAVKRMRGVGTESLADAARQRMRLAGMSDSQIRLIDSTGKVHPRLTVHAPISGIIAELSVREGMTVMSGAPMFRINGLDTVWVNAEVPEAVAAQVSPGAAVEARAAALPGTVLKGRVSAILPEVEAATRTLKARVELVNPGHRLVPGMFATVQFSPAAPSEVLIVSSEAVIRTGTRSVVMVAQEGGKFTPVDVETGAESDGQTEIRKGLEMGQKVVISGQFLIDSEASLRGTATRMSDMPKAETPQQTGGAVHRGEGKIESIDADEVTLSHGPISSMQWSAMTMGFQLPDGGVAKGLKVGDTVSFEFKPTKDGAFKLTAITPKSAGGKK